MSSAARSRCTPQAFEQLYRERADPWDFTTSVYERTRYDRTLAALSGSRYAFGFEPGCSIGELTARLAPRCDQLFAIDVSATAVSRARSRCDAYTNVRIECADVQDPILEDRPDLIVLSEIGYYFEPRELADLALRLGNVLRAGGTLIAVHWLGESADHRLHGDEVHDLLLQTLTARHDASERYDGFRLDRWIRP